MEQNNTSTQHEFEVEKKLQLTVSQSLSLIEGFDMVDQIEFTDTYWKDSGLHLPLRDRWLRKRGDEWVLKVPTSLESSTKRASDKYREIIDFEDIKQTLGVMGISEDFEQDLKDFGYTPWFEISSVRNVFTSEKFPGITITEDTTGFGYEIWEVEKCVPSQPEMENAEREIIEFIYAQGVEPQGYVRGKVHEYLFRYKPDEFQVLADAGVMK